MSIAFLPTNTAWPLTKDQVHVGVAAADIEIARGRRKPLDRQKYGRKSGFGFFEIIIMHTLNDDENDVGFEVSLMTVVRLATACA